MTGSVVIYFYATCFVPGHPRKDCLGIPEVISNLHCYLLISCVPRLAAGDPFPTPKMVVWIARSG